jgi:hypothetical protein
VSLELTIFLIVLRLCGSTYIIGVDTILVEWRLDGGLVVPDCLSLEAHVIQIAVSNSTFG